MAEPPRATTPATADNRPDTASGSGSKRSRPHSRGLGDSLRGGSRPPSRETGAAQGWTASGPEKSILGSPPKGARGHDEFDAKAALWAIQAASLESARTDRETAVSLEAWWGPLVEERGIPLRTTDLSTCTCVLEKESAGSRLLTFSADARAVCGRVSFALEIASGQSDLTVPPCPSGVLDEEPAAGPTGLEYTEEELEFIQETVMPFVRIIANAVQDEKMGQKVVAYRLAEHDLEPQEIEEGRYELLGIDAVSKRLMFRALHLLEPQPYVEPTEEPVVKVVDEGPNIPAECDAVLDRLKAQNLCLLEAKVRLEQGEFGATSTLAERFNAGPMDEKFSEAIAFAEAGCFLAAKKALANATDTLAGDITIIEP